MLGIAELNFGWYEKVSQFYMSERIQEVCTKYWWRNILYINNLFGRDTMVSFNKFYDYKNNNYSCLCIESILKFYFIQIKYFLKNFSYFYYFSVCLGVGIYQMICSSSSSQHCYSFCLLCKFDSYKLNNY